MAGKKKPLRRMADPEFYELMANAPSFEMVIKSAIVLESELDELFRLAFAAPDAIHEMGLRYEQKVALALAVGLLPRFRSPMMNLAKTRNVFAHQADALFTKDHADNLFNALDEVDQKLVETSHAAMIKGSNLKVSNIPPEERFVLCIITLRAAIQTAQKELLSNHAPR